MNRRRTVRCYRCRSPPPRPLRCPDACPVAPLLPGQALQEHDRLLLLQRRPDARDEIEHRGAAAVVAPRPCDAKHLRRRQLRPLLEQRANAILEGRGLGGPPALPRALAREDLVSDWWRLGGDPFDGAQPELELRSDGGLRQPTLDEVVHLQPGHGVDHRAGPRSSDRQLPGPFRSAGGRNPPEIPDANPPEFPDAAQVESTQQIRARQDLRGELQPARARRVAVMAPGPGGHARGESQQRSSRIVGPIDSDASGCSRPRRTSPLALASKLMRAHRVAARLSRQYRSS